jgi:hypothetical protein
MHSALRLAAILIVVFFALGNLVFGEEDDELEHAVARLLKGRGRSVAANRCRAGCTGSRI